ncbi:glycosyltransferase family 4 protein [Pseudomonas sp. TH43]|uniref:glycosyltransferase family 4 protein n=1 Tax=Pseudomonas sp. TH43 TaxID=2796407 RepID=UPI001911D5D4|nr:glycosyltransferase family 4 protein [Pseudomonas sp. TH43]
MLTSFQMACIELFDKDYYLSSYPDIGLAGVDPLQHFIDSGYYEGRMPLSITSDGAVKKIDNALSLDPEHKSAIGLKLTLDFYNTNVDQITSTLNWFLSKESSRELTEIYSDLLEMTALKVFLSLYQGAEKDNSLSAQLLCEKLSHILPESGVIKLLLALLAFRADKIALADRYLSLPGVLDSVPPELSDFFNEASLALKEAKLVNGSVCLQSDLLLLDTTFPSKISSFRYGEFRSYLEEIQGCSIHVKPENLTRYGESLQFHQQVESLTAETKISTDRLRYYDADAIGKPKVAYCVFLNLADYFYSKVGVPSAQHLLFTLYPGGGFNLNDEDSNSKLRRLCDNPKLTKIITTQLATYRYLIEGGFCNADRIQHIYGGIIPEVFKMDPEITIHRDLDKPLDVCFVAQRYSATGAEKGYDVFVEVVKKFSNSPNIRFHVVGGFDASVIDIGGAQNITYYGARPAEFFDDFYRRMDLILSPNIQASALDPTQPESFDGFPTTAVVEAGLRGVAVFLTDFKGFNQHLDGSPIFKSDEMVVINRDADRICSLINEYLNDRKGLFELGVAGRKSILREFSYEVQMRPRIELIKKCLADSY